MKTTLIELAERTNDGVSVRLLWRRGTDEVLLEVNDGKLGESFALQVPGGQAMDAFRHPFVYAGGC